MTQLPLGVQSVSSPICWQLKRVKSLDFFSHFLKVPENSVVYPYDFPFMFLGITTLQKIDEVVVNEGSEGDIRSHEKPYSLLDCHLQMPLRFGQLRNTIERHSVVWLMVFEML